MKESPSPRDQMAHIAARLAPALLQMGRSERVLLKVPEIAVELATEVWRLTHSPVILSETAKNKGRIVLSRRTAVLQDDGHWAWDQEAAYLTLDEVRDAARKLRNDPKG